MKKTLGSLLALSFLLLGLASVQLHGATTFGRGSTIKVGGKGCL